MTLYRALIYSEARWALRKIHHVALSPMKLLGTLCTPVIVYVRWRLAPPMGTAHAELAKISQLWYDIMKRGGQPPAARSLECLRRARIEVRLQQSSTLGLCFRALSWIEQRCPSSLDFWSMERFFLAALLALPLLLLNDLACCLGMRVRLAAALVTGGFGRVWGSAEVLLNPLASTPRIRLAERMSLALQALALPPLLLMDAAFVLLPPMLLGQTTRIWLLDAPKAIAESIRLGGSLGTTGLTAGNLSSNTVGDTPSNPDLVTSLGAALQACEWWAWLLASVWWVAAALSWQFVARYRNALWRPLTVWRDLLRPRIPRILLLYNRLLGWLTYVMFRHRRTAGCLGEVLLVPIVLFWLSWPLAVPLALEAIDGVSALWSFSVAVPATLILLYLATVVLRSNWNDEPQYQDDVEEERERAHRRAEEAYGAYKQGRAARAGLERRLLEASLRRLPTARRSSADACGPLQNFFDGRAKASTSAVSRVREVELRRTAGEGFGMGFEIDDEDGVTLISEIAPETPAAKAQAEGSLRCGDYLIQINGVNIVKGIDFSRLLPPSSLLLTLQVQAERPPPSLPQPQWSRDHSGARSDPDTWEGVVITFGPEVSAQIEDALVNEHRAWPVGDGTFVDLEAIWDVRAPHSAALVLGPVRRRSIPTRSHFALRRVDELGTLAASGWPEQFAHRVAPTVSGTAAREGEWWYGYHNLQQREEGELWEA